MTYKELLEKFFVSEKPAQDISLDAIEHACAFFWHPERSFESIHIAWTNGKGSVARMVFQMLKDRWEKVGIFTSPHLVDIRERFEIERGLISEEEFIRYAEMTLAYPEPLSYFERCTLVAFLFFREQWSTYGVIEVWMGGRLDATNVITPIVTAITSISYDHMDILGDTLESIAWEKAGIIKPDVPLVLYWERPTNEKNDKFPERNTILEQAKRLHTPVTFAWNAPIETSLLWEHQKANARIALEIGKILRISEASIRASLLRVVYHGRLEYVRPNLLIDWAHNEWGMKMLSAYLATALPRKKEYYIALKQWKWIDLLIQTFPQMREIGIIDTASSLLENPKMLQRACEESGIHSTILSPREIIQASMEHPEILYVIFGSLYILGDFLSLLGR